MAAGRFDSVSVTRRYRVLVPAAAAVVAAPSSPDYMAVYGPSARPGSGRCASLFTWSIAWCWRPPGPAGITAARLAGASVCAPPWPCWPCSPAAGPCMPPACPSPIACTCWLLAWATTPSGGAPAAAGRWLARWSLGPLAKESFFLLVPWLLWFGRPALAWPRQLLALAAGLAALFTGALVHRQPLRSARHAVGSQCPGAH